MDRVVAPDGTDGALNGADQPGARTMGAMALQRWVARSPGEPSDGGDQGAVAPTHGPYDEEDLDPELTEAAKVDFGAVRIPVPWGGEVTVEPEEGRLQAVHVMLPAGRLSVSALAAPRTERLWPDLAAEIDESLREGGATVRSFTGEWGRELHARTGEASSVFVGVDGPRWMLYGVATGPTGSAKDLDAALRRMLRGTVVVRGRLPYPVRTVLPLTVPEHLAPREEPHAPVERAPAARTGEPDRRPPAPLRRAPARPAAAAPDAPRSTPEVDDRPTDPYGLPPVAPAAANGHARPRTNGAAANGAAPHGAALNGAAANGAAANGAAARRPDHVRSPTGQRRVADLLAAAERDRAAFRAAQAEPTVRATAVPPRADVPPVGPQRHDDPPRYDDPLVTPQRHDDPLTARFDDGVAPVRLGDAPRARDAGSALDEHRWPTGASHPAPAWRPEPAAPRRPADGSDDWTLPLPVVPPLPAPDLHEHGTSAEPRSSGADLWAGDPWAEEARRAARAARRAERRTGHGPAVDVPAARVPPPVRPALAHLADEPDDHQSGRHRRPER